MFWLVVLLALAACGRDVGPQAELKPLDETIADGDGVAPVANNDIDFGSVCPTSVNTKTPVIVISRQSSSETNVFQNSSNVVVSVLSVTGAGLSASLPGGEVSHRTITLPSDWTSRAFGTTSNTVAPAGKNGSVSSTVTLTAPSTAGTYTGSVVYRGSGTNLKSVALDRNDPMNVKATVLAATDARCTAPVVSSITLADSNPTNATNVSWTVTFSKTVTGVDAQDFGLVGTGVTGAAIGSFSGSGSTYTITASTGTGNGTLGLNLADDDSIVDGNGNKLGGAGSGNGSFTGQVYTINKQTATSISDVSGSGTYGDKAMLTAKLSPAVSGKSIEFKLNDSVVGSANTNSEGVATLNDVSLEGINVGTHTGAVKAGFAGDSSHTGSNETGPLTVTKASHTITFDQPASPAEYNSTFNVAPTSSASLPVSVIASGSCSINNGTVTMTSGNGTCTLTASQAGNDNVNAAENVMRTVEASKADQTITFDQPTTPATFGSTFNVAPTSSANLTVGVAATGSCSISNGTVTMTSGLGTCTLTASQAGDGNIKAAENVVRTVAASKANAVVNVSGGTFTYDGNAKGATGTATGVGGGDLSGLLNFGDSFTNAGPYTANWSFAGDDNHNAANGSVSIVINKADQAISWSTPAAITYGTALGSGQLNAVRTQGDGALTYAPTAGTVLDAGTHTLRVEAAGTTNYNTTSASVQLLVNKAQATVSLSNLAYIWDGSAKSVTVTTVPASLSVTTTYNGSSSAPSAFGSYNVVATINETNYQGSASGTLVISAWTLRGFYSPVDMSSTSTIVWNTVKNGSTVPLKFNVFAGTTERTSTADIQGFSAAKVSCSSGSEDVIEEFFTTGSTSLRYSDGQFIQNWATPKAINTCYKVTLTTKDTSTIVAYFKLK